jgi:hypothetical protein
VSRRPKLNLRPERPEQSERVPGFERAEAPSENHPPTGETERASDKALAPTAPAPPRQAPDSGRWLRTLAVVAATALALYLLKRRLF